MKASSSKKKKPDCNWGERELEVSLCIFAKMIERQPIKFQIFDGISSRHQKMLGILLIDQDFSHMRKH